MVLLAIVLLVVVGPRDLPRLLRTAGRGITKLRRMSVDLREQSGIDEIIQDEGLREDLDAIRSLSRHNVVESFVKRATRPSSRRRAAGQPVPTDELSVPGGPPPLREQEYPLVGCDCYDALADDAEPYVGDEGTPPREDSPPQEDRPKAKASVGTPAEETT